MRKILLMVSCLVLTFAQAQHRLTLDASRKGAEIQPTMYGVFFEDINFGADGGLYAEMVQNRSFEYPQSMMGWKAFGNVAVADSCPAFSRNPHYVTMAYAGHPDRWTGMENQGYFGMGVKEGAEYCLSLYVRQHSDNAKGRIRAQIVSGRNVIVAQETISLAGKGWRQYSVTMSSPLTDANAKLRIVLETRDKIDVDHVSLMPVDNWNGLRTDLVKDLEDLKPGVFRFPGGCIVEGADTATRYQWKNTVGPAENRPLNENRWNYTSKGRAFPQYFQSLGLGFYEYFLLSEKIGAEPLPILSCGMVCQYQNKGDEVHVALDEMDPYIQDAIDLVEFANGATDTRWGAVRAKMGHPEPFNLKYIGIGNEQWGPLYPERLKMFIKALRKHCPDIKIIGSSGPKASGDRFDDGWAAMRQLDVDLVDEHYYMPPQWFLDNAARYDAYPRTGPKVFAGEYAAHDKSIKDNQPDVERNNFAAALSEAAFMTGIERNADIVLMATYAPLFAHVDGWQWRPDLIWFDNLSSVRSANWYVQMMYSTNKGTHVLPITENKASVTGINGLYASAVYDAGSNEYVIKMVNASYEDKDVTVDIRGAKGLRKAVVTSLHADDKASNSMSDKRAVVPVCDETDLKGNSIKLLLKARTFAVYRLSR